MPSVGIMAVAALGAAVWFGGHAAYTHVIKPTGCGIKKVVTLGHKTCAKPATQSIDQPVKK